jgi:hypothetical protein
MPEANESTTPRNVEAIASGITEVIHAALGVGAAVSKTIAEATAGGQTVPPGSPGEGPVADMIHYGVQAVSNVTRQVIRGMPSTASTPHSFAAAEPVPSRLPYVHAGSELRIPLSIENPSDTEMPAMKFVCAETIYQDQAVGTRLTSTALTFQPESIAIAPHDFEKLTVLIATAKDTAAGPYLARIGVEGGTFETALRFEVIPATP